MYGLYEEWRGQRKEISQLENRTIKFIEYEQQRENTKKGGEGTRLWDLWDYKIKIYHSSLESQKIRRENLRLERVFQ